MEEIDAESIYVKCSVIQGEVTKIPEKLPLPSDVDPITEGFTSPPSRRVSRVARRSSGRGLLLHHEWNEADQSGAVLRGDVAAVVRGQGH